ncbi:MAG: cell wall hydrolase [Clostridia bacterium]|nr:cell wall hydrolase [Clostridia bacterium]
MKKSYKLQSSVKSVISFITATVLCLCLVQNTKAQYVPEEGQAVEETMISEASISPRAAERTVRVYVKGQSYGGRTLFLNSVTYVGFREFSMYMGAAEVTWDSQSKTARASSDSLSVTSRNGDLYITANGRYLWARSGVILKGGTMYVPLRTIAKAFGAEVTWNPVEFAAYVSAPSTLESGQSYYDSDSVYWLARIIHAESAGEPLLGKVAVGTVVLNRVKSQMYPETIYGVIFDKKNGVQFTPSVNGAIYCTPSADSIIAAKLCLDGASISERALFFVNEAIAESTWVSDNRPYLITVGNHKFYA